MFGKNLKHELIQYLRRLWPFAIGVVATGILAMTTVLVPSRNNINVDSPVLMSIALFGMSGIAITVRALVHAFISFFKKLSAENEKNELSLTRLLWIPITSYLITMTFIMLFLVAGVTAFAWEAVGQKFLAFKTEWLYFIEFLFYFVITACTLYIIPTTWIAVFRFSKQKKWPRVLSMIVGILAFLIGFFLLCAEIVLLTHSSQIMLILWVTVLSLLVITVLIDVGLYFLVFRTLKTSFTENKPTDNNSI